MTPEEVTDFGSFVRFVDWLARDRADEVEKENLTQGHPMAPGPNGWENATIEGFLESAAAWAMDMQKKEKREPEPSWQEFARFLHAGKVYE